MHKGSIIPSRGPLIAQRLTYFIKGSIHRKRAPLFPLNSPEKITPEGMASVPLFSHVFLLSFVRGSMIDTPLLLSPR